MLLISLSALWRSFIQFHFTLQSKPDGDARVKLLRCYMLRLSISTYPGSYDRTEKLTIDPVLTGSKGSLPANSCEPRFSRDGWLCPTGRWHGWTRSYSWK